MTAPAPLSLTALVVNLLLSIALSTALAWFYARYGQALSNRARFAQTLPLMAMTTVLIISVVKSSLALSLGLVGALSIVRFRTAIKEPEKLLQLFMAIGVGLSLGADQRWSTTLAALVFLGYQVLRRLLRQRRLASNLYLNVVTPGSSGDFTRIRSILLKHISSANLRRLDASDSGLRVTCLIECRRPNAGQSDGRSACAVARM